MPMENSTRNEYRPVFSTTSPRSQRNLLTTAAGIPRSLSAPPAVRPGMTRVTLIGSSST
ncbi:hypothetical protein D3C78_1144960 [compost metagenome]